jgi:hypothetical protein
MPMVNTPPRSVAGSVAARTPLERQRVALFKSGLFDYMREGRRLFVEKTQAATTKPVH